MGSVDAYRVDCSCEKYHGSEMTAGGNYRKRKRFENIYPFCYYWCHATPIFSRVVVGHFKSDFIHFVHVVPIAEEMI